MPVCHHLSGIHGNIMRTRCNRSNKKCKENEEKGKVAVSEEVYCKLPPPFLKIRWDQIQYNN